MNHPTPDAKSVFGRAAEIPSPAARTAFLDEACASHPAVRAEVEALLKALGAAGSFMGSPAAPGPAATGAFDDHGTGAPEPSDPEAGGAGQVVAGRYTLVERIGEGGMGAVWRAKQTDPVTRFVAVKLIKAGMDSRQVLARFEAERQALALMDHPNIARILDGGVHAGRPFFVMELVKGTPITEFCDARKLTPKERLELFVSVCQAVQHAHQKGVIHRDLKPSNVLVALYDDKPVVKVIDFGVAKAAGQPLTERTIDTGFGGVVGTPEYMSPEQATFNNLDVDTRTDVYALGVLLYELLVGSPPFSRKDLEHRGLLEMLRVVREEEPQRPSRRLSTSHAKASIAATRQSDPARLSALLSSDVDWIVMKALEKDRVRRYDTATALAKDVERFLAGDAVEARPPTLGYRLRKLYRRNRAAVWVKAAFAGLVVGAAVMGGVLAVQARRAEATASENEQAARRAEADANTERDEQARQRKRADDLANTERLIRYAAEMNLLQAAYDSKNMAEVKRLLLAQVPQPGEPDVRGPEWHYWDRKLNGFHREVRFRHIPPDAIDPVHKRILMGGAYATLSADGTRLVTVDVGWSDNRQVEALTLRLWDAETSRELQQAKTDRMSLLPRKDLQGMYFCPHTVKFVRGGRCVLLECGLFGGEYFSYAVWDLSANTIRRLDPVPGGLAPGIQARFTDDLRYAGEHAVNAEGPLRVIDVVDGRVVYTTPPVANRFEIRFTPDGQSFLVRLGGFGESDAPSPALLAVAPQAAALSRTTSCYRLPDAGLVWQRATDPMSDAERWKSGTISRLSMWNSVDELTVTPNGTAYWFFEWQEGSCVLYQYSVRTGKRVATTPLFYREDSDLQSFSLENRNHVVVRSDGAQLAYPTEMGFEVVDVRPEPQPARRLTRYVCLEGSPKQILFRPDGSLITLHTEDGWATIRTWPRWDPRPENSTVDYESPVASPDRTSIAMLSLEPGPVDDNEYIQLRQLRPQRQFRVVTPSGQTRYTFDCSQNLLVERPSRFTSVSYDFSTDGRFLFILLRCREGPKPLVTTHRIVIRDLQTNTEHARIDFPRGTFVKSLAFNARGDRDRLLVSLAAGSPDGVRSWEKTTEVNVYEFPSGRFLWSLPPAEAVFPEFSGNTIRSRRSVTGSAAASYQEWDGKTGANLGLRPAPVRPIDGRSLMSEQLVGTLRLRLFQQQAIPGAASGARPGFHLELWQSEEPGGTERLILQLHQESVFEAYLNLDGTRLICYTPFRRSGTNQRDAVIYCTTSGRPLLRIPDDWGGLNTFSSTRFGWGKSTWSPDGTQFWVRLGRDGLPEGIDFRPREGPKP